MANEFDSIDGFLNHKGTQRSGGKFLKGWKKNGKIDLWLHTRRLPVALWQHKFPRRVVREDKNSRETTVSFFGNGYNCFEDESVLVKQYHRTPSGERELPPCKCPFCKTVEAVRDLVEYDKLAWTAPIFQFTGATDPKHNTTIHAAGFFGGYGGQLSDDQIREIREAGIRLTDAWSENAMSKCNYVFVIVDNDHPELGVQITTETKSLGDKVKDVINNQIASREDKGNPMINPYVIQCLFDDAKGTPPDKRYSARPIERIRITEEIAGLIRSEPPDLKRVLAPFNAAALRATMERYCVIDLPWDNIFAGVEAVDDEAEDHESDADPVPAPKQVQKSATSAGSRQGRRASQPEPSKVKAAPVDPPGDPCENCHAPMTENQTKCGKCGTTYELDGEGDHIPF